MRMLMKVTPSPQSMNEEIKKGTLAATFGKIMEAVKPEAAYFIEEGGNRTVILIVNPGDVSQIPSLAEPWFLSLNAKVEFHPAMTVEDLQRAGLEALGKQWS